MRVISNINWDSILNIAEKAESEYLEEAGQEVINQVKGDMPIQTGKLRNSTYFQSDGEGHGEFHSDAPYAEAVDAVHHYTQKIWDADFAEIIAEKIRRDFE